MSAFYCVEHFASGLATALELNGVPLLVDATGEGIGTLKTVNAWIVPGENRFEMLISAAHEEFIRGEGLVETRIFIADPAAEIPKPGVVLGEVRWPSEEIGPTLPYLARGTFEARPAPETRLWGEAEPVGTLGEADRKAILDLVARLRASLAAGRAGEAFDLCRYKFEDEARADGLAVARIRKSVVEDWEEFASQPGARVPETPPGEMILQVVARGRLVKAGRTGTGETVCIESPEMRTVLRLYFAKVSGAWKIVR